MAIAIISGTTPANTGQLATTASANFSAAYLLTTYSSSYAASSTTASLRNGSAGFTVNGIQVVFYSGSTDQLNTQDTIFINDIPFDTSAANFVATASAVFNASASAANSATNYSSLQGITSTLSGSVGLKFDIGVIGSYVYPNVLAQNYVISGSTTTYFSGATLYGPAGSGVVTAGGPWSSIQALADANVTISGSALGVATFVLATGNTFTTGSGLIQAITVNNPQGSVLAS
jgi:hypothetical protein